MSISLSILVLILLKWHESLKPIPVGPPVTAQGPQITAEVTISNTLVSKTIDGMILPSKHVIDKKLWKKQYPVTTWEQSYEYLLSDYFLVENISLFGSATMLIYLSNVLRKY